MDGGASCLGNPRIIIVAWFGLADFDEFASAGVLVATSNATVAAKHIAALNGRIPFLRGIMFFIVVPFFVGAVRRFLV